MNIKKSQLKEMIKAVAREAINERKEKWIQKAVNPKHKGYCTPMTKKTCTPRRKALAKRFKKGIDEGENPFKDKGESEEKKENPFKKKDKEEPEAEEPTDTKAPTNMVSDTEPKDAETDGTEPVGPPKDVGGEEAPVSGENGEEHDYDEKEEILLIKVVEKAVQKLLDMHQGMEGSEEDPTVAIGVPDGEPEGEEVPVGEPSVDGAPEGEEDEAAVGMEEGGSMQQESAPPGFGPGKAHADIYNKVESQYGKDSPKKYATLWKIYNQMSEAANAALQECGMEECGSCEEAGLTSEMGPESKVSPLDDIVRLVKNKGLEDPQKEEYLVSRLFKHQYGKDADPEALKQALERGGNPEMEEAAYKEVAPHSYTDAEENKARRIQTEPRVNENTVNMKMGPSYKVEQPHMYQTAEMDWARSNQYDPKITELFAAGENNTCPKCQTTLKETDEGKLRCDNPMCECSKKLYEFTRRNFKEPEIKENHKVQARSFATVNDMAQDPNNVRDPEVPGP